MAVRENKSRNPKNTQEIRAKNIKKISLVDEVFSTKGIEDTLKLLSKIKPGVFVLGYDQDTSAMKKIKEGISELGLKINFYTSKEFARGIHTSNLH